MPSEDVRGKVVVVAGGGTGEGLSTAEGLVSAGARVAIWEFEEGRLAPARSDLPAGAEVDWRVVDLTDQDDVARAYRETAARLGEVDAIVCQAILKKPFILGVEEHTEASIDFWEIEPARCASELEVNFLGTFNCCSVAARHMVRRGRGSLVTQSTSPATMLSPAHVPYGPAAAAIESFTRGAAVQLRPHGVRINAVQSGGTVGRRHRSPDGKLPHDVMVPAIRYLVSDASSHVCGEVLVGREFVNPKR